jgi:hypothetical protein
VFCRWPEVRIHDYDEVPRELAAAGDRPAQDRVVGWIGNVQSHPVRAVLHRLGLDHPDLLDVRGVESGPAR